MYKGDPPVRLEEYKGSGDLRRGGWAIVNYENRPVAIAPRAEMATAPHEAFTLKGCVHDLGHALGLPHFGPLASDRLGNTLIGPRTEPFWQAAGRKDDRVYLSEAEGALLWKHWAFSGTTAGRATLPSVRVADYKARYDAARRQIVVTGRLESDGTAHSVVLTDDAEPRQADYWRKAYAARVGEGGRFEVRVREPARTAGTFRLLFCFDNGAVTGDGKTRDLKGAFAKTYSPAPGGYRFDP